MSPSRKGWPLTAEQRARLHDKIDAFRSTAGLPALSEAQRSMLEEVASHDCEPKDLLLEDYAAVVDVLTRLLEE
jgi:hypothetical protein